MNLAIVIFVFFMVTISAWCILLVRVSLKKNIAARRERDGDFPAQIHAPLMNSQQALVQARAEARKQEAQRRAEVWKNMTPSLVNEAFRDFYKDEAEASFDTSLISAAFEKFTKDRGVRQ